MLESTTNTSRFRDNQDDDPQFLQEMPVMRGPGLAPAEKSPTLSQKALGRIKHFQLIGVSLEGNVMRVAKVVRGVSRIEIAWLKSLALTPAGGAEGAGEFFQPEDQVITDFEDDKRSPDMVAQNLVQERTGTFLQLVDLTEGGTIPLAVAVSEPDVYYDQFETNWGLHGRYLLKKVASEMGLAKQANSKLEQGEIRLVKMNNKRLLAIYCGRNHPFFSQMELVKKYFHRKLPKIASVESVELSLVNLVNDYHSPDSGTVTAIANLSNQSARFIFMVGREIYHLSPIIGEGLDSRTIRTTVLNRLQFELDTMNIRRIDNIFIAGPAGIEPVFEAMQEQYPMAHVSPLRPHSLDLSRLSKAEVDDLSAYNGALGAALGLLDPDMERLYKADLTPVSVRESQNRLSLSPAGWLMLLLIPSMTVGILYEASNLNWELKRTRAELIPKQAQIKASEAQELEIEQANAKLASFEKGEALLDSLQIGNVSYGESLVKLMETCGQHTGAWFTEISTTVPNSLQMVGYSLSKNDLPVFVREAGAEISLIEAQEIRNHPVYRFEIKSDLQVARD